MGSQSNARHLEIDHLTVGFTTLGRSKQVLDLGHVEVAAGEAFGLVGESGSGKTVLALALLRLLQTPPAHVSAKSLAFNGHQILSLSQSDMRALRGREIAMVFQDPMSALNPVFTVGSQLLSVIGRIHGERGKPARERALRMLSIVELPDVENMLTKYPHQLSGGQRQRVVIALALSCDARFIIADEPTRNLDVTVQAGILKTIARLRNDLGVSLLFIANNLALVAAMCDRVGLLLDGRIVETGTVDEVVGEARHPYTHLLLRAVPSAEEGIKADGPPVIAGMSRLSPEAGGAEGICPFWARCPEREQVCGRREAPPGLIHVGGSHEVACHGA